MTIPYILDMGSLGHMGVTVVGDTHDVREVWIKFSGHTNSVNIYSDVGQNDIDAMRVKLRANVPNKPITKMEKK